MSFWSGGTLARRLPALVDPFHNSSVDCAAYTLHVGDQVYVSPDHSQSSPSEASKQQLKPRQGFAIPPGQFAFLLSEETVTVPKNALAFISIKARQKFAGLINISGFHVDPGYQGKLLFSVLNAGPKPLHLEQGQPLFLIWYADLDQAAAYSHATTYRKTTKGFDGIDPELITKISGEILSFQSLSDKIRTLERKVADYRTRAQLATRLAMGIVLFLAALGLSNLAGFDIKDLKDLLGQQETTVSLPETPQAN